MSVLQNFMFVFQTDGEITTAAKQFSQLKTAVEQSLAPVMALGMILSHALDFAAQGEQLLFMARAADMTAGEFQKLAIANERFGGDLKGAAGTMAGLAAQVQALKSGQAAPLQEAAFMYGLDLQAPGGGLAQGNELLRNIAAAMERLTSGQRLDLGRRIGLDAATLRLLSGGLAQFEQEMAAAEKHKIFTPQDLARAEELLRAMRDFKLSVQAVWAEVSRWLMPAMQDFLETAASGMDYLSRHQELIKAGLIAVSAVLAGAALSSLAALAAASWAWLSPLLAVLAPVAAVAAALALLYEDFMTFASGGKSALDPLWRTLVDAGRWFQDAPDWVKTLTDRIKGLADPLEAVKNIFNDLSSAWNALKGSGKWLAEKVGGGLAAYGANLLMQADANPLAAIAAGSVQNAASRSDLRETNIYHIAAHGVKDPARAANNMLDHARDGAFYSQVSGQEA